MSNKILEGQVALIKERLDHMLGLAADDPLRARAQLEEARASLQVIYYDLCMRSLQAERASSPSRSSYHSS